MTTSNGPRLIMLGTAFDTRGGIATVVNTYRACGLFERWPIDYIATHCDGKLMLKLFTALKAFAVCMMLIVRRQRVILHVHSASRASFWRKSVFMSIAFVARWPVIFHLHGGGFAQFYEDECTPLARCIVRFFLERAACVIVLSMRWHTWMAATCRNPKIVCVSNPVSRYSARKDPPPHRRVVLFLGRLERQKGIFDLLDAVAAAREVIPDIKLVCAGAGDIDAVRQHARALGIADAVTLTGWVDAARVSTLLKNAAVFVLPSYAEGLPMSLLEAMGAGVPVVASRVGGIADVIADGVNGFLISPGDTRTLTRLLRRLCSDSALGGRLGTAARESVMLRFDADQVVARLERLYAEIGLKRRVDTMQEHAETKLHHWREAMR